MALSLITEQKKRDSILGSLLAPEGIAPEVMAGPLPSFAPAPPTLEPVLNQRIAAPSSDPLTSLKDQTEADLFRRMNPVAPTTALGKIGHTAANAANVLGEIFAPAATANIKGSRLNNQERIGDDKDTLDEVSALESQRYTRAQTEANTRYLNARPDIEQSKIDQKQTAVQQRVGQAAAARGQKVTWGPDGLPTFEDDHDSQAFSDHQALSHLHDANAEKAKIQADIAKNHYIPGTPEFTEAQRKLQQADTRLGVAMQSLGLRAQGVAMRRETLDANLYGKGADGQPLVGAPQIMGEDGQLQTVGLRAANTAIKQQKGVGTFNDLVGSVDTTRKALEGLHTAGGSFADAQMIAAMNDPHSMVGKYVNGQLVKGNLNDKQIEALGAVNQLREQIGILRASTGGTAAEAQAQRMLDTLPTAGDSPAIVRNKLKQIDGVLQRLSPSVTSVRGGLSVGARTQQTPRDSGPSVGTVEDGHRFKGGNPADANNWEKVSK